MSFEQAIAAFEPVSAQSLENLIATGEKIIAFVGRSTCPYCQRFAPKLATVQAEMGAKIYFLDSSRLNDKALQEFRAKHHIVTVPGLLVADGQTVKVVCDSSLPVEEIKAFIA